MVHWRRRRRFPLLLLMFGAPALAGPPGASAQSDPELQTRIDSILGGAESDAVFSSMGEEFLAHFILLVPELPEEDRGILADVVDEVFAPEALRAEVARTLAGEVSGADVDPLAASYRSGPLGELRDAARDHSAEGSFEEFSSDPTALDRERLQLMLELVEARRSSDLSLTVEATLRQLAHRLVTALGGAPGEFVPMTDEEFAVAYRNRTIRLAVESMYRMEPASDDLVAAAVQDYRTEESRRFTDAYVEAVVAAIGTAGQELASRLQTGSPAPQADIGEPLDPSSVPPCRLTACGFLVEWRGQEPTGDSQAYGRPGDLEDYTYEYLVRGGYHLVRGRVEDGLTIHLIAQSQPAYCEMVVGLNPRGCLAVGQVRVDFVGSTPGFDGRNAVTIRNRCRANAVLAAQGISSLVAARIHYELTTYPGDERREPRC